jgi:hypothetical protein
MGMDAERQKSDKDCRNNKGIKERKDAAKGEMPFHV